MRVDEVLRARGQLSIRLGNDDRPGNEPAIGRSDPSTPSNAEGCPSALRACPLTNRIRTVWSALAALCPHFTAAA